MNDVFLEFSHIYADENLNDEHTESINHARKIIREFEARGFRVTTGIMIDELHITENKLNVDQMINDIEEMGIYIDHVAYESKLGQVAEQILNRISHLDLKWETYRKPNRKVLTTQGRKVSIKTITNEQETWSCAILSAAWTLCRLGIFEWPEGSIHTRKGIPVANEAFSILQSRFAEAEEKATFILQLAGFETEIKKLNNEFI